MRWLILILVLGFLVWRWQAAPSGDAAEGVGVAPVPADQVYPGALRFAPKTRAAAGSTEVVVVEMATLIDSDVGFDTLAKPGHYTVVEVYLDSCAICRRLESTYPAFFAARDDVVVRKVHMPEGGLQFSSTDDITRIKARIDSFAVCGTPHIEVYAPDGALLAADRCGDKDGLEFLREWIRDETGLGG